MISNSQRSEFVFEALEPRLLLSADGLSAAGMDPEVERDVVTTQDDAAVVVAYSIDATTAQTADAGDDIFDVAGQTMQAAVEASEPAADSVVEASVAAVSTVDSGASGTEPVALYSVYDGSSATSAQLVQTLNASNAPPSEVDGGASVSTLSSLVGTDETGDLQMQALSVLPGETDASPTIQAFETGGITQQIEDGLTALADALWTLIQGNPDIGEPRIPGIRYEHVTTGFASPTVLDAFSIFTDQFYDTTLFMTTAEAVAWLNAGLTNVNISDTTDLEQLVAAIYDEQLPSVFPGDASYQLTLPLLDLNDDGEVTLREAFQVLVVANLTNFINSFPAFREVADANLFDGTPGYNLVPTTFDDLRNGFTNTALAGFETENTGPVEGFTDFLENLTVPSFLAPFITLFTTDVTDNSSDGVLEYDVTFNFAVKQPYLIDLGIAVEQLEIYTPVSGFVPGDPSEFDPIDFSPAPFADLQAEMTLPLNFRATTTGFSYTPSDNIGIQVFIYEPLNGVTFNVGFLGMQGGVGSEFLLNFPVDVTVTDPSSPYFLGFGQDDFAIDGDGVLGFTGGVVSATDPVDPLKVVLQHDVIFSLGFGLNDAAPIQVTVTAASTADNLDLLDPENVPVDVSTARQNLVDDVNTALGLAGLTGIVTASLSGDLIVLTLDATDASPLGFATQEQFVAASIDLVAVNSIAALFNADSAFEASILVLLGGGAPRLVTFSFNISGAGVAARRTDFLSDAQAAIDSALGGGVLTLTLDGTDHVTLAPVDGGDSLEITQSAAMNAEFAITAEEFASAAPGELFALYLDADLDFFRITVNLDVKPGIIISNGSLANEWFEIEADLMVDDGGVILFPLNDDIAPDYIGLKRFVLADHLTLSGVDHSAFDPETDSFQNLLDFNLVGAPEVANLIGQLKGWLDRLQTTSMLGGYALPFVTTVIGEFLTFGDLLEDKILFDDGGDGVDAKDKPIAELNDQGRLLFFVEDSEGNKTIMLAFATAQEFAAALNHLPSVEVASATAYYDMASNELTYDVEVSGNGVILPAAPTDFDLDLSPIHDVSTEATATIISSVKFEATIGLDLNATAKIEPTTDLDDLNNDDGVSIGTGIAITGAGNVSLITGRLTGNATFTITQSGGSTEVRVFKSAGPGAFNPGTAVNPGSDTFTFSAGHGLTTGDAVVYDNGGGSDIGNLTDGTTYYVVRIDSVTVQLAASFADAVAATPVVIDLTGTGSGASHTIQHKHNTDDNFAIGDLLADINEAIATAGLGSDFEAVVISGRVVIQAKSASVTAFNVSANLNNRAYTELGIPTTAATTVFLTGVPIDLATLTNTASFTLTINGAAIGTIVNVSNMAGSNSVADVVNDVNDALAASSLGNKIVAARNGNRLVLAAVDASVRSFEVSNGANLDKLGLHSSQLTDELSGSIFLTQVAGVFFVGETFITSVPAAFGRIAANTDFTIRVNEGETDEADYAISILASETETFTDLAQLISLLNDKIEATALNGKVVAYLLGSRINLRAIDSDVLSIEITETSTELGLVSAAELGMTSGARAGAVLRAAANRDAPSYYGPSADAHFSITYYLDNGADPDLGPFTKNVTLLLSEALSNRTIYDLVSDITLALNTAFEGAGNNPFAATFDGQRLVIRPKSNWAVTQFSITADTADTAVTDLHLHPYANLHDHPFGYDDTLPTQTVSANRGDFLIFTIDGSVYSVALDDPLGGLFTALAPDGTPIAKDISEVQAAISAATGGVVTATINSIRTGLNLHDGSVTDHGLAFRVESVNGSRAAFGLGLQAASEIGILVTNTGTVQPPADPNANRLIRGDAVGRLDMQDRLFLRQVDANTPFLSGGAWVIIGLGGTADLPDTASYGFVGIQLSGISDYVALVEISLNNDGGPLNNVTLAKLLNGLSKDLNRDGYVDIFDLNEVITFPHLFMQAAPLDTMTFNAVLQPGLPAGLAADLALVGATVGFKILNPGNPFNLKPGTAAFDPATPGIVDYDVNTITINGHGFATGDKVTYRAGEDGKAIGGLIDNKAYYVIRVDANTFKLAATLANALVKAPGVPIAVDLTDNPDLNGTEHRFLRFDPVAPVVDIIETNFGNLVKFADIGFSNILSALQKLRDFLNEFAALPFLSIPIPVIGTTLNDLLAIASSFSKAVNDATNNPAATLQILTQKLREAFGLPPGADIIKLALVDDNDGADGNTKDMLKVSLDLDRAYTQAMMIDLDFGTEGLPVRLLGKAGLGAKINIDAIFSVGVDLDNDGGGDVMGEVFLFTHKDDTSITFNLDATSSIITFNAALGPLGVMIIGGDGQILINIGFSDDDAAANTRASLATPAGILAAFAGFTPSMTSNFEINLPVYFPNPSSFVGDVYFKATWGIGQTSPTIVEFTYPTEFDAADFFDQFSIPSNLTMVIEALDLFLETLQDILSGQVLGLPLPLIGDKLSEGALFIEDLRMAIIKPFRELVAASDKSEGELVELVQAFLFAILGNGVQPGSQIDQDFPELISLLTAAGLNSGLGLLSNVNYAQIDTIIGVVYNATNFRLEYKFNLGDTINRHLNFDFDLGLPALGLDFDGGLAFEIKWALSLGVGVSSQEGVYINLTTPNEFMVQVDAGFTPNSKATGKLGFLQLSAQTGADGDGNGVDDSNHVTATFTIDLQNGSGPDALGNHYLSFFDLGNLKVVAGMGATADLNLLLELAFNRDLLPPVVSAILPAIEARFILAWGVSAPDILDSGFNFDFAGGLTSVKFVDIYLDLGSFLGDFLGPIVSKIQEYTEPLQPIIEILTARIPVLSDLAGKKITLVDIAATFGEFDPGLIYAIADLISFVNSIPANPGSIKLKIADDFILVGSGLFGESKNLLTDPTFKFADAVNPESGSFIGTLAEAFENLPTALDGMLDAAGNFAKNIFDGAVSDGNSSAAKSASSLFSGDFNSDERGGFAFPFLQNPASILGALLGNPIVLVTYDLPPLVVEFTWEVSFPIYPPLYGVVGAGLGVKIDLAFGYDTLGVQKFVEGGFSNPLDLLSGFYISDRENPDGTGADVGELQFKGQISVGAELNAGVASAGVTATIALTVNFDLNDPDNDGRVRISELLGNFLYEWREGTPALAPLAIFDIYGDISFFLSAYIKILLFEATFDITPKIVLFEFEIEFDREPILATERGDGSLLLNIGPNAGARLHGNTNDIGESINVKFEGGKLKVWSDQFGVPESAAQSYNGNKIIAYGGQGNDTITIGSSVTVPVYIEGNSGNDVISALGSGAAEIYGNDGDDTITGGSGADVIFGGEGADTIDGGGSTDIIFGDDGRVSDNLITAFIREKDGNDTITGGQGRDIIFGGGGEDRIGGDGPFVLANPDSDTTGGGDLIFGDGARLIRPDGAANTFAAIIDNWARASFDATGGRNDVIHGHGGNDVIYGGRGDDIVDGGNGNDTIFGGPGFDYLTGAAGGDTIYGGTQDDVIYGYRESFNAADPGFNADGGADGNDTIYGEDGNDFIRGNNGNDTLYGGRGTDIIFGDWGDDKAFGEDDNDFIFGGPGGELNLQGGGGNDIVFGDDGIVVFIKFADISFSSSFVNRLGHVITGEGHRIIGDGTFTNLDPYAAAGVHDGNPRTIDVIQSVVNGATDGNDYAVGGEGDDIVMGGAGDDTVFGDFDPGLPFAGPVPAGDDILFGDGGRIEFNNRQRDNIRSIVGANLAEVGVDHVYGNGGSDVIFGNGKGDFLYGRMDSSFNGNPALQEAGDVRDDDIILGDDGEIDYFKGTGRILKIFTYFDAAALAVGGADEIYGNKHDDIAFGGIAGDLIKGDDGLDGDDVLLGDNGEIVYQIDADGIRNMIATIKTTDVAEATGGADTIEGQDGNDVIFGGVNNGGMDMLYGDRSDPTPFSISVDGQDIIIGDNGEVIFNLTPQLDQLDLIRSYRDNRGGVDTISGNAGNDVLIGSTGGDIMFGDDAAASAGASDGEDIMLGDNGDISLIGSVGRLLVQVAGRTVPSAVDLITTTDLNDTFGGADTMSGNAKADIMLGGINAGGTDTLYGDRAGPTEQSIMRDGDDVMLGDNGLLDFTFGADTDRYTLDLIRSFEDALGGADLISGNKGLDVAIGGTGGDTIYGDDATASAAAADLGDLLIGDNADVFLVAPPAAPYPAVSDLKLVLRPAVANPAQPPSAVKTIRTTDTVSPLTTGGVDIISGNAGSDIIAGGVYGDFLYGDRQVPNATTSADDGSDIILGDNGAFEWLSTGRLGEINDGVAYIDIEANNAALWAKYGTNVADTDLTTLDLITTEQPNSGGRDTIYGDEGDDIIFGGTDLDVIYGDDGDGVVAVLGSLNRDVMFGDHGRIYPQFSSLKAPGQFWQLAFNSRNFFAIHTGDGHGGEGDLMWGEEGADIMLGQQGDDRMWGGSGDDDMIGGHNVAGGWDELTAPAVNAILSGVLAVNDLMDGGTGDDAMAGDNTIMWRRGDDFSPRFRTLANGKTAIYSTGPDGVDTIITNIDSAWRSDPADVAGRDIQLVDHSDAVQTTPNGRFGADVMAGGPQEDTIFGQLGNDLIQGDGLIGGLAVLPPFVGYTLGVTDSGANPDTDATLYFNIPEVVTDGNDYIEGNGGSDLLFGGLGQDDIIGGSSALFGLDLVNAIKLGYPDNNGEELRPDGSDIIFGGAGNPERLSRNDFVGATDTEIGTSLTVGARPTNDDPSIALVDRHSRDADFIMGDNANVYRLVSAVPNADAFLEFNYDQTTVHENRGSVRIIVRAMEQLDYTLGGADYAGGTYVNGAAVIGGVADNGAADIIYGESGDDYIFGMTGSDALYGNSDDDDLVGGYGHDWISGGTGQDGVLGDDGLLYTSRNSTQGEPLYGVAGLSATDPSAKYSHGTVLDEEISTPGDIQYAVINPTGALKKTADLVPFSFDPNWLGMDDEFPDNQDSSPFADDIIFGGLDGDFLHGGSGDDAISGAEALLDARVPTFDGSGNPIGTLNLGYSAFSLAAPILPGDTADLNALAAGDWLAFNPVDVDGQHLNNRYRAGEFFLYDEYDPRRKIMLDSTGDLWKSDAQGVAYEFVLNFNEAEGLYRAGGTVPKATGQQTESYGPVNDDGKDAIFGDNGNDWLVGGTGRDNLYGGWGNDLLNADDKHDINDDSTKENTVSDTHPYYEDRAYGGAGRDVLIGNTGGDRLIDWVGEYNSYLVPYAPFGQATVSRTLQPFLPEFLYALSAGDGADFTRYTDAFDGTPPAPTNNNPNPSRNGEPNGELGLVLQKDFAWQDQTGAPADPQAGNIPGGHRDVLRSAGFNDGTSQGFFADSGTWSVKSGVLTVAPQTKGSAALSVFYVDDFIPSYFEVLATVNAVKPVSGYKANAYIVFDYQSETDFKFAGIDVSNSKLVIGQRTESGWTVVKQGVYTSSLKAGTNYNLFLSLNGSTVTLIVDNKVTLTHVFAPRIGGDGIAYGLSHGMVGLGADNSKASIDNMIVQRLAPVMTFVRDVDFGSGVTGLFAAPASGTWNLAGGRYDGTAAGTVPAVNLIATRPAPAALIDLSAVLSTTGAGGFVFDYYNANSFKFVAVDRVAGTVTLGHRTAKGWFTDAVYTNAAIKTSADQNLGLTIKGTTVSVKWNNALVISFAFNALATDGATGLLSRSGTTSFNSVKFQTDDPGIQAQAGTTSTGSSAHASMMVEPAYETSLETVPSVLPSVSTIATSLPMGPVSGSIVNNLLGTTNPLAMVSGFSGTGGTMTPMVTSDLTLDSGATISVSNPLPASVASGSMLTVASSTQSWTLASVRFDVDAMSASGTRSTATESTTESTDSAEENVDASSEVRTLDAEAGIGSIFDLQMLPPTSHGAVEPRKVEESQPDFEDGGEPDRPQPDAN